MLFSRWARRSSPFVLSAAAAVIPLGFVFGQKCAWSQQTPPPSVPAAAPTAAPPAPGMVTLTFFAPTAQKVAVEVLPGGPYPMQKGDDGTWKVTVGPFAPEIYEYRFLVDDKQRLPDPKNEMHRDTQSLLVVPGPPDAPALWEINSVPHGSVTRAYYPSATLGNKERRVHVYTPPGYNARAKKKYPLFFLLHGSGDDDASWVNVSRANVIFDNLLAQKRIRPMIVVMPMGHVPTGMDRTLFEGDLLHDLLPWVEQNYQAETGPKNRAIAGLSMGGAQSLAIGLNHPDTFGYIGAWSAGARTGDELDTRYAGFLASGKAAHDVKYIYLSCGSSDRLLPFTQTVDTWLTQKNVPHEMQTMMGSHEWKVWRQSLIAFAPHLFGE